MKRYTAIFVAPDVVVLDRDAESGRSLLCLLRIGGLIGVGRRIAWGAQELLQFKLEVRRQEVLDGSLEKA